MHRSSSTQAIGQLSPDPSRPHLTTASSQVSLAITGLAGYGGSDASETRQIHTNERTANKKVRGFRRLLMTSPRGTLLQDLREPILLYRVPGTPRRDEHITEPSDKQAGTNLRRLHSAPGTPLVRGRMGQIPAGECEILR